MKRMCTRKKLVQSHHGINEWVSLSIHLMTESPAFRTKITAIKRVVVSRFAFTGATVCRTYVQVYGYVGPPHMLHTGCYALRAKCWQKYFEDRDRPQGHGEG